MSEIQSKHNLDDILFEILVNIIKIIWGLVSFLAGSIANLTPIVQTKERVLTPENKVIMSTIQRPKILYSTGLNPLNTEAWAFDTDCIIDCLDSLTPTGNWGFGSSVIMFYFEFLKSELKYFYDNVGSEQDLSQNLVIGARILMSAQFDQSNAVSMSEFAKASNLINQGGRKSHKYSKLCKELMAIVQTRIKLESGFGYSPEMIEAGLDKLQNICDQDGLTMPNNVLIINQEVNTNLDTNGLKNPSKRLSFGQIISLLFIVCILGIITYYIVKY